MAAEEELVEKWVRENIQNIVPQGITPSAARRITAKFMLDHMSYDFTKDKSKIYLYQGVAETLKTWKGKCSSYAKLYALLLNSIPFDLRSGLVDYQTKDPYYLDMRICIDVSGRHEWNYYIDAAGICDASPDDLRRHGASQSHIFNF